MLQRTLAVCVFALFLLGTVSESQAGGFLQRLRGKVCSGRSATWDHRCRPPKVNACAATPNPCAPSPLSECSTSLESVSFAEQATPSSCYSQLKANCAACDKIYSNDPVNRAKCRSIALQLYCQCIKEPASKSSMLSVSPPLCACHYPADPNGTTCMDAYDQDSNSPDPNVRRCAPACYFGCLNQQSNPDLKPPVAPVP